VSAIVMADIERVVDLMLLAKKARADLLKGLGSIDKTVKIENAATRALQRLNLPAPGSAAPVMSLLDHAARRANESEEAE
jgi:hypothetical protein